MQENTVSRLNQKPMAIGHAAVSMRKTVKVKNPQGFTLMEMMLTLAIIGILTSIAIPNAILWRNNAQLNAATRRVKDDIEATRMAAIKSNLPADFIFNAANAYDTQTRNVMAGAVALRPIETHQLAPGVTIAFNNGGQITFNNRGMTGNNGTITLLHTNGLSLQIVVSILGSSVIQ